VAKFPSCLFPDGLEISVLFPGLDPAEAADVRTGDGAIHTPEKRGDAKSGFEKPKRWTEKVAQKWLSGRISVYRILSFRSRKLLAINVPTAGLEPARGEPLNRF
jgi:hypothetical protein